MAGSGESEAPPAAAATSRRREALREVFGLDLRSLALFRVLLALLVLCDVVGRFGDLEAHYGEAGVLPLALVPTPGMGAGDVLLPFSLHLISAATWYQGTLLALEGLVGLALLAGWQTRVATAAAWFLTLSVFARNPLVYHGGDLITRLLLFWGMFLPLGACASIDARGRPPPPKRVVSLASFALLWQMCLLFWFAALDKYDPAWRSDGDAVYRALIIGHLRTAVGDWVLQSRGLMKFLTFATLVQEAAVPFLLFVPWRNRWFRTAVVVSFLAFHLALGLCMSLGSFFPACAAGWLALAPSSWWDGLAAWRARRAEARATAAGGAADAEAGAATAGVATTGRAPLVQPLAAAANVALGFLIAYVTAWNVANWNEPHAPGKNALLEAGLRVRDAVVSHAQPQNANLGYVLGLDESFYFFAPKPAATHGWLVLDGTLADGGHVDLLPWCFERRETETSFLRPKRIADSYPNLRWRKYLTNLIAVPPEKLVYRQAFAAYAASLWNRGHAGDPARRLKTLDVVLMRETTMPNYQPVKREKIRLVRLDCTAPDLRASSSADLVEVPMLR
jgi:hypothetical protein